MIDGVYQPEFGSVATPAFGTSPNMENLNPAKNVTIPAESGDASDSLIESFRNYLLRVADHALPADLKAKEGASDVVQDALVDAHRLIDRFAGKSHGELRAWLHKLLMNKVAHLARRYRGTDKRALGREMSLERVFTGPYEENTLAADHTSPGGRAVRNEEEAALLAALDRLSEKMRQTVLWRHHENCTFDEIGRRLNCSNVAARKLWLRGLERLQRELTGLTGEHQNPAGS
jgi:RNA polymerase sigma-70 factor (ECF subfamily)